MLNKGRTRKKTQILIFFCERIKVIQGQNKEITEIFSRFSSLFNLCFVFSYFMQVAKN